VQLRGLGASSASIGHNGPVAQGKRVGPKKRTSFRPTALLLAVGITIAVVAWGYLVKAAIDFGIQARNGTTGAWTFLGLAGLGAVACLFVGLMMVARLLRTLGITSSPSSRPQQHEPEPPRPVGGRRSRH
jgi:hypothetical protein